MSQYQLAMFRSYWLPLLLFYVVPCGILLITGGPVPFWDWVVSLIPVFTLFGAGYIVAPYFGPKIKYAKSFSFLMAYFCLLCVYFVSVMCFIHPGDMTLRAVLGGAVIVLIFGSLPAILGAVFFIGACNQVHGSS